MTQIRPDAIRRFAKDNLFNRKSNLKLAVYTITRFFLMLVQLYCISRAVGAEISLKLILLSIPLALIMLFLAFTPSGIGIYDIGWYGLHD